MSEENSNMFFVGCTISYSYPRAAELMTKILAKYGVKYGTFDDEPCCGGVLSKIGQSSEAEEKVKKNIEYFKNLGIKRIVTNCPECYLAFKKEYTKIDPSFDKKIEILHYTTLLANLIREKKIVFKKEVQIKATYHDPCELGRHMEIYEDPRFIIKSIPGIQFKELKRNLEYTQCCGGPIRIPYVQLRNILTKSILKEAKRNYLITTCPACYYNFRAVKELLGAKSIPIDLIELVAFALNLTPTLLEEDG
ncbi:MAG: (Fe-S)-binding protein [Candidatus Helarchaeota archaeon]|nr:(Fe-S)-binding protein [Candidatus Helarchaeota archaeon]